jgi:hypothetical protein
LISSSVFSSLRPFFFKYRSLDKNGSWLQIGRLRHVIGYTYTAKSPYLPMSPSKFILNHQLFRRLEAVR